MNDPSGMWAESPSGGITRTVVDPIGNIIYHDDKDNKIYRSPDGKMGRDGNVDGLTVVGEEKPGEDYHKGGYLRINYYGDHQVYSSRIQYLYSCEGIEEDYTLETILFPGISLIKYLKYALFAKNSLKRAKSLGAAAKGSLKGKSFRGGNKKQRDGLINKFEKDFQRWFHRDWKVDGDPNASYKEIYDAYKTWVELGKPKAK